MRAWLARAHARTRAAAPAPPSHARSHPRIPPSPRHLVDKRTAACAMCCGQPASPTSRLASEGGRGTSRDHSSIRSRGGCGCAARSLPRDAGTRAGPAEAAEPSPSETGPLSEPAPDPCTAVPRPRRRQKPDPRQLKRAQPARLPRCRGPSPGSRRLPTFLSVAVLVRIRPLERPERGGLP